MLATSRKAIVNTVSKATYATAATANSIQISSASNGVKVASSQEPGQTASLSVVVNGGARAESGKNAGVSHFLKNYGFRVNTFASYNLIDSHLILEQYQPYLFPCCS